MQDAAVSGMIEDSLQLEHSLEEPVQQATTQEMLVEASQLMQGFEPEATGAIDYLTATGFPAV